MLLAKVPKKIKADIRRAIAGLMAGGAACLLMYKRFLQAMMVLSWRLASIPQGSRQARLRLM
jgi:hypothetical protein